MRLTVVLLLVLVAGTLPGQAYRVSSPDSRTEVSFSIIDGKAHYAVSFAGREVIRESVLGLVPGAEARLDAALRVVKTSRNAQRAVWEPVYGERSEIPDRYNEISVELQETIPPARTLVIEIRAYDEGVAFRYRLPRNLVIEEEATEFRLPPETWGWDTPIAQAEYRRVRIADMTQPGERPYLLELPNGIWAAIAEAGVEDYSSMFLAPLRGDRHSLAARLRGPVHLHEPFTTPWRVILVGHQPGELLEHNYLLLNLSPSSRVKTTDWIRPGKVLREVTLSTRGGHEAVDFAIRHGIQYIEYDAGWYGHEYAEGSDATRVSIDPRRLSKEPAYQGLDLRSVVEYARSKGLGVWLYVNRRALERQIDTLLPLYANWGVVGVKYGFVNVHTQEWTRWLYDAVAKAAANRLMIDIHDEFRPTGMSRTWPNLLTQEGILGNEGMPDARHSTILPFTRMLAGAADYTFCWLDERLKNTWGHQLALTVVLYSPLQFVYWYDRPVAFTKESPGMEWFRDVPTVWDDTRVLDGTPGEFAIIARRKGTSWFLGAITGNEARSVPVRLTMLSAKTEYAATIFSDGEGGRDVRKAVRTVRGGEVLELPLQARGGVAVRFDSK